MARSFLAACCLVAATLPGTASGDAAQGVEEPSFSREELDAARLRLNDILKDAGSSRERTYRIVRLALIERPDGAFGEIVRRTFEEEGLGSQSVLVRVFLEGDATVRRSVLDLYRENWNVLGRGTDSWRGEMVRIGLESDDRDLRRAAAHLAANAPMPKMGHVLVDATLREPELTQAAILSLGTNRDVRPLRWALDLLASDDPRLGNAVRWTLRAIGTAAAGRLRERIERDPGHAAPAAVDGLLHIASRDDVSILYSWLERHGDAYPELADRVTDALAAIEIGNYRPPQVERPELEFFPPS